MEFRYTQTTALAGTHNVRLDVTQTDPVSIRVEAGAFKFEGIDYSFDEVWDIPVSMPDPARRWVNGFVAIEVSSGDAVLLVDEFTYGSLEERYDFNSEGGPYRLLHLLFGFEIPADQSNLDGIECDVYHLIEDEVE